METTNTTVTDVQSEERVFLGKDLVLMYEDRYIHVEPYVEGMELKLGDGYIIDKYVYIYRGKYNKESSAGIPGIYKKKSGEIKLVEPVTKAHAEQLSVNAVLDVDPKVIVEELISRKDDFVDLKTTEILNNNTVVFMPQIKETDDFLKKIIKKAIRAKGVNLANYKDSGTTNTWTITNLKSSLNRDTALSTKYFQMWCEILGLRLEGRLVDNGTDKISPLNEPIEFTNEDVQ